MTVSELDTDAPQSIIISFEKDINEKVPHQNPSNSKKNLIVAIALIFTWIIASNIGVSKGTQLLLWGICMLITVGVITPKRGEILSPSKRVITRSVWFGFISFAVNMALIVLIDFIDKTEIRFMIDIFYVLLFFCMVSSIAMVAYGLLLGIKSYFQRDSMG